MRRCNVVTSETARCGIQKAWIVPLFYRKLDELMSAEQTQAQAGRARLIAAAASHSGEFRQVVPCTPGGRHTTRR
jgi:hypothetical protein